LFAFGCRAYLTPCPSPANSFILDLVSSGWRRECNREGAQPLLKGSSPSQTDRILELDGRFVREGEEFWRGVHPILRLTEQNVDVEAIANVNEMFRPSIAMFMFCLSSGQ
jgi:hypothetical protein